MPRPTRSPPVSVTTVSTCHDPASQPRLLNLLGVTTVTTFLPSRTRVDGWAGRGGLSFVPMNIGRDGWDGWDSVDQSGVFPSRPCADGCDRSGQGGRAA